MWETVFPAVCFISIIASSPVNPGFKQTKKKDQPMQGFTRGLTTDTDWNLVAQNDLKASLALEPELGEARNLLLFIGDGMGVSTVTAARTYHAQSRNLTGYDAFLAFEKFPYTGFSQTYAPDFQVPDSAGTATAFLCGEKARNGVIGVNQHVVLGNCSTVEGNKIKSMLMYAMDEGKWAGLVTTARVTHATPAAAYAHSAHRNWEADKDIPPEDWGSCPDIAYQMIYNKYAKDMKVFLGGGRRNFLPNTTTDPEYPNLTGSRTDGLDLIQAWKDIRINKGLTPDKYAAVWNKEQFDQVNPETTDYLLGLFEPSHMQYDKERLLLSPPHEPSLTDMVNKAIRILRRAPKGFVLLVEGGRIDHAHHENRAALALDETTALSDAVAMATSLTDTRDTLTVVSADHSHVFTYNGYPTIDANVLGLVYWKYDSAGRPQWDTLADGKPYTVVGYQNGPGFARHRMENGTEIPRRNITADDTLGSYEYVYDSGLYKSYETHAGEDVAIYAQGPMAQLFRGVHEQNYIAHVMMYAACIGPNKDHCNKDQSNKDHCNKDQSDAVALSPPLLIVVMTLVNCIDFLLQ